MGKKSKPKRLEISESGKAILRTLITKTITPYATTTCWLWPELNWQGYGVLVHPRLGDFPARAHRIAYAVFKGSIPPNRPVLHTCKVNGCVNPAHLFLGNAR